MNLFYLKTTPDAPGVLINRPQISTLRIEAHSRHNLLRFILSLANGVSYSSDFRSPDQFAAVFRGLCSNLILSGYEQALEDALARAAANAGVPAPTAPTPFDNATFNAAPNWAIDEPEVEEQR